MKLSFAAAFPALFCVFTHLGGPRANAAQLAYDLYVLGAPVGEAALTVDLAPATYRVALSFHTAGVARLVSHGQLDEFIRGTVDAGRLMPRDYEATGFFRGQRRIVKLTFQNATPAATAIDPPNETEREAVPATLLPRTIDPLTGIAIMLRQVARTGRCDGGSRVFDGRRVEAFDVKTGGEEDLAPTGRSSFTGRALRCDFTSLELAGFRFGDSNRGDAALKRGAVWIAPLTPGGARFPVRVRFELRFLGEATIYLTGIMP